MIQWTFNETDFLMNSSPDVWLDAKLFLCYTGSYFDLRDWFLLWYAFLAVWPFIKTCVPFQIIPIQLKLPQVTFTWSVVTYTGPHASKNPSLCPYQRKTKSHAWMTGGPLLWPPSSASVLRSWSETTSALCCLLHWTHYNLHTAVTVPQTMLLPSPCTLLSPTWKIKTPMWGCCSWIIVQHLTL